MVKRIIIRQMSLLNFKGVRELTVDFDEHETNIYGANHTGKTTLFDAFVFKSAPNVCNKFTILNELFSTAKCIAFHPLV